MVVSFTLLAVKVGLALAASLAAAIVIAVGQLVVGFAKKAPAAATAAAGGEDNRKCA